MEFRVNVLSAQDLKYVNIFTTMKVYVVVSINDNNIKQKTPVDKESGCNPEWNHTMKFIVNESVITQNLNFIVFVLKSSRLLGDRDIGTVRVSIKELFDQGNSEVRQSVSYSVVLPNGKSKGVLNFSYWFEGHRGSSPPPPPQGRGGYVLSPGMYPPSNGIVGYHYPSLPPPHGVVGYHYPPPSPPHGVVGYHYPPPSPPHGIAGYHYLPPLPSHNYQHSPLSGHGYHHQQQHSLQPYGENGKPQDNGMSASEVGLGIAAAGGVAGGLVVGNMVSDVVDSGGFCV